MVGAVALASGFFIGAVSGLGFGMGRGFLEHMYPRAWATGESLAYLVFGAYLLLSALSSPPPTTFGAEMYDIFVFAGFFFVGHPLGNRVGSWGHDELSGGGGG